MFGALTSKFSFSKIVTGVNKTLGVVNQIVPIYKQVKPVVKNVRSALNTYNMVKKETHTEMLKNISENERPVSNFKPNVLNDERGFVNIDTLSFFQ